MVRASTEPLTLGIRTCKPVDAATVDCTEALARQVGRPSLYRVILSADQDIAAIPLIALVPLLAPGQTQSHGLLGVVRHALWIAVGSGGWPVVRNGIEVVPLHPIAPSAAGLAARICP